MCGISNIVHCSWASQGGGGNDGTCPLYISKFASFGSLSQNLVILKLFWVLFRDFTPFEMKNSPKFSHSGICSADTHYCCFKIYWNYLFRYEDGTILHDVTLLFSPVDDFISIFSWIRRGTLGCYHIYSKLMKKSPRQKCTWWKVPRPLKPGVNLNAKIYLWNWPLVLSFPMSFSSQPRLQWRCSLTIFFLFHPSYYLLQMTWLQLSIEPFFWHLEVHFTERGSYSLRDGM